jgi:hypothetical protein
LIYRQIQSQIFKTATKCSEQSIPSGYTCQWIVQAFMVNSNYIKHTLLSQVHRDFYHEVAHRYVIPYQNIRTESKLRTYCQKCIGSSYCDWTSRSGGQDRHRQRVLDVFDLPKMLKPRYELGYLASLSCSYLILKSKHCVVL